MPSVYGRLQKIHDAGGRHEYLTDGDRQEEVVLHEVNMQYDWEFYSQYEQAHSQEGQRNNEALEIHVALPNELYEDREKLKTVCDDLAKQLIQGNNDYEYAVHWNHSRTNLHVHIMFSEREPIKEREVKVYAKDIWQDKDTHKLAKAHAENAELVHRKGEVQRDKEGNIKYKDEPLSPKNTRFKNKNFVQEKNHIIGKVLKEHGYDLRVQTKDSPYLSQKKLYKGASEDYLQSAKAYNEAVKDYNNSVEQHIQLEPEIRPTYCQIRHDVEDEVRQANRGTKKITKEAIQAVKDMCAFVKEQVKNLTAKIRSIAADLTIGKWWQENKDDLVKKVNDIEDKKDTIEQADNQISIASLGIDAAQDTIEEEKKKAGLYRDTEIPLSFIRFVTQYDYEEEDDIPEYAMSFSREEWDKFKKTCLEQGEKDPIYAWNRDKDKIIEASIQKAKEEIKHNLSKEYRGMEI